MVHGKKISYKRTTPPSREGFVFVFPIVFPIVFHPFFPKVSKQSQSYEPVSILTWTIYVLSSRARIMRGKQPLTTRNLMLNYEKFNVKTLLNYEKFNVIHELPLINSYFIYIFAQNH